MFFLGKLEIFMGLGSWEVIFLWVIRWNGLWFNIICLYFGVFIGKVKISKFNLLLVSCWSSFLVVFFCIFKLILGSDVENVFSIFLNKKGVIVGIIFNFNVFCF